MRAAGIACRATLAQHFRSFLLGSVEVSDLITHRGDGLPANHCNGQFRADGK
jgi:hypothetical protein